MLRNTKSIESWSAELAGDYFYNNRYTIVKYSNGTYSANGTIIAEERIKEYIADLQELLTK